MRTPSLVKQASQRLGALEAFGCSRYQAKRQAAGRGTHDGSTGRLHSTGTKRAYWHWARAYAVWARPQGYRHIAELDRDRATLVDAYLRHLLTHAPPYSAYTMAQARSALRLFHSDRLLGHDVPLPRRSRRAIRNNRGEGITRGSVDLDVHAPLIAFLGATGLRRREVRELRVKHVLFAGEQVQVYVPNGKGGRTRVVTPLDAAAVRAVVVGRGRTERVFDLVPDKLRVHVLRRQFAQACYLARSTVPQLPPQDGRLRSGDYDLAATRYVSEQLGHSRADVVLLHYLR